MDVAAQVLSENTLLLEGAPPYDIDLDYDLNRLDNHTLRGYSGCNQFSEQYSTSENSINFDKTASTRKM